MDPVRALPDDYIQNTLDGAGIKQLVLPFSGVLAPVESVNAWLFADAADGVCAIDTGQDSPESRKIWIEVAERNPISSIHCTHNHPDHFGLAKYLHGTIGAPIHLPVREIDAATERAAAGRQRISQAYDQLMAAAGYIAKSDQPALTLPSPAQLPEAIIPIQAGDNLTLGQHLCKTVSAKGHSPQGLVFLSQEDIFAVTGDHILPDKDSIVTVDVMTPFTDPLSDYFTDLDLLANLPEETIGLPGHGGAFLNIGARARTIRANHERRCAKMLDELTEPATCLQLLPTLFSAQNSLAKTTLRVRIVFAILNHLQQLEQLSSWTDELGTRWFVKA